MKSMGFGAKAARPSTDVRQTSFIGLSELMR